MLQFNLEKFDFWPIYERIKKFYPLGIVKDEPWGMYLAYPGLKKLTDIIIENIHNEKNYQSRWTSFTTDFESLIGKEIIGTTYGQAPGFSAYAVIEKITVDSVIREKQLQFFVSLVGPFYSVIGQEIVSFQSEDRDYRTTGYLVVSPEKEFAEVFMLLCDKIEDRFKGFRFVPFEIGRQTIDGLDVRYSNKKLDSIFHALFNDHVELDTSSIIGTGFYKAEDWIKEGYVEEEGGGWTMYPPME
jgi:hypothetical protein